MAKYVWKAKVDVYNPNRRWDANWESFDFTVIAKYFLEAYEKLHSAIRRQGFRHHRYRINSISRDSEID